MLEAALASLVVFTVVFVGLRLIEWLYHRLRHTPDWSAHWGSWAFAVLAGIYVLVTNLGR